MAGPIAPQKSQTDQANENLTSQSNSSSLIANVHIQPTFPPVGRTSAGLYPMESFASNSIHLEKIAALHPVFNHKVSLDDLKILNTFAEILFPQDAIKPLNEVTKGSLAVLNNTQVVQLPGGPELKPLLDTTVATSFALYFAEKCKNNTLSENDLSQCQKIFAHFADPGLFLLKAFHFKLLEHSQIKKAIQEGLTQLTEGQMFDFNFWISFIPAQKNADAFLKGFTAHQNPEKALIACRHLGILSFYYASVYANDTIKSEFKQKCTSQPELMSILFGRSKMYQLSLISDNSGQARGDGYYAKYILQTSDVFDAEKNSTSVVDHIECDENIFKNYSAPQVQGRTLIFTNNTDSKKTIRLKLQKQTSPDTELQDEYQKQITFLELFQNHMDLPQPLGFMTPSSEHINLVEKESGIKIKPNSNAYAFSASSEYSVYLNDTSVTPEKLQTGIMLFGQQIGHLARHGSQVSYMDSKYHNEELNRPYDWTTVPAGRLHAWQEEFPNISPLGARDFKHFNFDSKINSNAINKLGSGLLYATLHIAQWINTHPKSAKQEHIAQVLKLLYFSTTSAFLENKVAQKHIETAYSCINWHAMSAHLFQFCTPAYKNTLNTLSKPEDNPNRKLLLKELWNDPSFRVYASADTWNHGQPKDLQKDTEPSPIPYNLGAFNGINPLTETHFALEVATTYMLNMLS